MGKNVTKRIAVLIAVTVALGWLFQRTVDHMLFVKMRGAGYYAVCKETPNISSGDNLLKMFWGIYLMSREEKLGERYHQPVSEALLARDKIGIALMRYFDTHGRAYPDRLEDLVPGYLDAIPAVQLPGYKKTAQIKNVSMSAKEFNSRPAADILSDSGGWLYFSKSKTVLFDAKKKSPLEEVEYYKK
ncbi:MAG TPA: hypothetical protein PLL10_03725 [Elusimicrobiales bacterium]|nr:hypothetical protein [Elusimicrobiales bacterium]